MYVHGKVSTVTSDGKTIFKGLGQTFQAMRYHSLAVKKKHFRMCLKLRLNQRTVKSWAYAIKRILLKGVQFHPESIMTPVGKRLLKNFLKVAKGEA